MATAAAIQRQHRTQEIALTLAVVLAMQANQAPDHGISKTHVQDDQIRRHGASYREQSVIGLPQSTHHERGVGQRDADV